jgi:hypothetical protein
MYNTTILDSQKYNDILTKVSEYDIYKTYFGDFKVGQLYRSPFRKDRNPSFAVYVGRQGNLLYKDHGTGESGNVITFVSKIVGLSNYKDVLNRISKDLKVTKIKETHDVVKYTTPKDTVIGIVRQPFTTTDTKYWESFHISTETLKKFDVNSIRYYVCNGVIKMVYNVNNPMFAYKVYNHFKIYRPLADKHAKWRNNLTDYDIQGYKQLPKNGDLLFITKSLKDVMVLHELGYFAISPSSETTFVPTDVLNRLRKRFKRIIVLFDRDVAGMKNSRVECLKTGLNAIFINKRYKAKDISDAVKLNGFDCMKKWLDEEVKRLEPKSSECNTNNG